MHDGRRVTHFHLNNISVTVAIGSTRIRNIKRHNTTGSDCLMGMHTCVRVCAAIAIKLPYMFRTHCDQPDFFSLQFNREIMGFFKFTKYTLLPPFQVIIITPVNMTNGLLYQDINLYHVQLHNTIVVPPAP